MSWDSPDFFRPQIRPVSVRRTRSFRQQTRMEALPIMEIVCSHPPREGTLHRKPVLLVRPGMCLRSLPSIRMPLSLPRALFLPRLPRMSLPIPLFLLRR